MNYFEIIERLDKIYTRLEGKIVDYKTIVRKLNRALPFSEVRIVGNNTLLVTGNNFLVSGLYDPELDEDGKPCIEIEIDFPRNAIEYQLAETDLTRAIWSILVRDIVTIMGHEYIHLHQFRRREFRDGRYYNSTTRTSSLREKQEYFGIPDEVEAYAFNIAADMADFLPNKKVKIENTTVFKLYSKTFGKDHPILIKLKRFSKKNYKLLERQYYDLHNSI